MAFDSLPLLDEALASIRDGRRGLVIEVQDENAFNQSGSANVRRVCEWIEASGAEHVTLDLCRVGHFCSPALGRVAQCIAMLQRDGRQLHLRVAGRSLKAIKAIGLQHVVPVETR